MSLPIFQRMSCGLPPEIEQEFRLSHEASLQQILPFAVAALGVLTMAFAAWNVLAYGAGWQPALLLVATSIGLATIAFRRTALRWSATQRAGYLYWLYGCALILIAFLSDKGAQAGMPVIAAVAFLPALCAVNAGGFLWMAGGPLLLLAALATYDAAAGDHGGKLAGYVIAIALALLLMTAIRFLRQKAFLLELQLARTASRDGATGLFNRNSIIELAAREFMRARRHERPFAVAMIDIDRFTEVGDNFGAQAQDGIVIAFAAACRAHLREIDLLGRVGGDRFVCVLPEAAEADALACVRRLRECIEEVALETPKGPVRFTVSIGVAVLAAGHVSWESMMHAADAALSQAKSEGRNRVVAAWMPASAMGAISGP